MKTKTCYETHENCNDSSCNHEKPAAFTPGPWQIHESSEGAQIWTTLNNGARGTLLSRLSFASPTMTANARLIAAAPELLVALQHLMRYDFGDSCGAKEARAAIAKATT